MVFYEDAIKKALKKGALPKGTFQRFNNIFISLDTTHDLGLFNIKKLKSSKKSIVSMANMAWKYETVS